MQKLEGTGSGSDTTISDLRRVLVEEDASNAPKHTQWHMAKAGRDRVRSWSQHRCSTPQQGTHGVCSDALSSSESRKKWNSSSVAKFATSNRIFSFGALRHLHRHDTRALHMYNYSLDKTRLGWRK